MRTSFLRPSARRALRHALLLALATACTATRGAAPAAAPTVLATTDAGELAAFPVSTVHLPRGHCATLAVSSSERGSDYLRPQELRAMPMPDLATLLQHRRPLWLSTRPTSLRASQPVIVYLNGAKLGGTEVLASIPVRDIKIARHIRPTAAVQRYGTGHAGGVIELFTEC